MSRRSSHAPRGLRWMLIAIGFLVAFMSRPALATPVIPPGQEAAISDLAKPFQLSGEIADGWHWRGLKVGKQEIEWVLLHPSGAVAGVKLGQPAPGTGDASLPSFSVVFSGDPTAKGAREALVEAIRANDDGSFWRSVAVERADLNVPRPPRATGERTPPPAVAPRGVNWGSGLQTARALAQDGIVHILGLALILLLLAGVGLRGAPRWHRWALAGAVLIGAAIRFAWSPEIPLAPWPYSRLIMPVARVFAGTVLQSVALADLPLVDVTPWVERAYATLAPIAIFVHARYLLGSSNRAIAAALILAVLPLHIRFSASDTAFIPSITICATAFAMIHAGTRAEQKSLRVACLALLPFVLMLVYEARPLNILYGPLLVVACFLHGTVGQRKWWVLAACTLVVGVTVGVGIPELLEGYGDQVERGLRSDLFRSTIFVVFGEYNILANPSYSPPLILAAAIYGGWRMWRGGERLHVVFLCGWLFVFLVAHAYVVPGALANQARYHLHLVSPYLLLAACGACFWIEKASRTQIIVAAIMLAASPLLHYRAMTDVAFSDQQEFAFTRRIRRLIPQQCTVVEYAGEAEHDSRFGRMGTTLKDGYSTQLWTLKPVARRRGDETPLEKEVVELLRSPPECLVIYQGLSCFGFKEPHAPIHPICAALQAHGKLEVLAEDEIPARVYDEHYGPGLGDPPPPSIPVKLWRLRSGDGA